MKGLIKYLFIIAGFILFGSCQKVLDKMPVDAITPDLWNDESQATLYLNRVYDQSMPVNGFGLNASNSDETHGSADAMYGRLTLTSIGDFGQPAYLRIRDINIAIEGIQEGSLDEATKGRLLGQAYILRAWQYWELVRLYGGVPLVLVPQNPFESLDLHIARSKTSESIDFIISDLDKAITGLTTAGGTGYKWPADQYGRVTRGTAAALKGRILMFWASPQFNPNNLRERWQRAYDANSEAKTMLITDGYSLMPNFNEIFLIEGSDNKEAIFRRPFNLVGNKVHTWENSLRPRSIGQDGGQSHNPVLNLVEAFPMKNGKNIDEAGSGYDPVLYWKDRDPRFYHTIVYNGANYTVGGEPSTRKQWHYYYYEYENGVLKQPLVLRSIEAQGPTSTGFYTRKASNPDLAKDMVKQDAKDWIEIRYAEVLLNLAECANEIDLTSEAYTEISAIRERAKIDPADNYGLKASMTKEEMREVVMQERQIEFAFENKRYWDLRRRNMYAEDLLAPTTTKLNGTRRFGIRVILKPEYNNVDFQAIRDNINLDTEYSTYFTTELWQKDDESVINYLQPQYNFFAIPPPILDRSILIKQTNGWPGGSFDPYE